MIVIKKISEVLETCNNCKHLIVADNRNETKSSFAICMFKQENALVILESQSSDVLSYKIAIPEFCKLEDYTTRKQQLKEEE